jgi:hypothetical protein
MFIRAKHALSTESVLPLDRYILSSGAQPLERTVSTHNISVATSKDKIHVNYLNRKRDNCFYDRHWIH